MTDSGQKQAARGIDDIRRRLLAAALDHAGQRGWNDAVFKRAAAQAAISARDLNLAFPDGIAGLLRFFCAEGDRLLAEALAGEDLAALRFRDRVAFAVRKRLEIDAPHKRAVAQAVAAFGEPAHMRHAMPALYATADAIWQALGDQAQDFNRYTKRAILAGIYGAVVMVWLRDETPDLAKTHAFLDRRIEDVMRFERAKAGLGKFWRDASQPR
jgi:ubiquinone biosynthesis protein COQ9